MHVRQFCVTLRGPAGAGKSALAREIQRRSSSKVAVIDIDLFNWIIVPGEDDKGAVYENVVAVTSNYLRRGYSVVVEGLIITSEEQGALEQARQVAKERGAAVAEFYCRVPKDVALRRNEKRDKAVPAHLVGEWWELAERDKKNVRVPLVELDMTVELDATIARVWDLLASNGRGQQGATA